MNKTLPLFPLNIVVFPGELVNLHVFEPRYKQLTKDCQFEGITFGIPPYINEKIDFGTEVELATIHRVYENERMDISVKGVGVFQIVNYQNPLPGKLYAGGKVEEVRIEKNVDVLQKEALLSLVSELFELFSLSEKVDLTAEFDSYTFAHKIGLTLEQEYAMLQMNTENERMDFLIQHLKKSIPVLKQMEEAKEKIRANGHFKHLDPLKF